MSGKTSETRCDKCYFLACPCAGRGVCGCVCHSEPTPPGGEAVPEQVAVTSSPDPLNRTICSADIGKNVCVSLPKERDGIAVVEGLMRNAVGFLGSLGITAGLDTKLGLDVLEAVLYELNKAAAIAAPVVSNAASEPLYTEQELKDQGLVAVTTDYGKEGSATMYVPVAPDSYKPAEGPTCPKCRNNTMSKGEVRDEGEQMRLTAACCSCKWQTDIYGHPQFNLADFAQFFPAATPVTVEAPAPPPCSECATLQGKLSAVVILLRARCSDKEWDAMPETLAEVLPAEIATLRKERDDAVIVEEVKPDQAPDYFSVQVNGIQIYRFAYLFEAELLADKLWAALAPTPEVAK